MDIEVDENIQKRRERIGLIVFVVAILGIFSAVFSYITIGHGFDLSASDIDSNIGQLEGYLTIVFDGDNTERNKRTADNDILKIATDFFGVEDTQNNSDSPSSNNDSNIQVVPATVDNVDTFYWDKGSTTCQLKYGDYNAYTQGQVFERGFWKLGVISVTEQYLNLALAEKKAQIKKEMEESGQTKKGQNTDKTKQNISGLSETSKNVNKKTPLMKELQSKISNLRQNNEADIVLILSPHQDVLDLVEKVDCAICKTVYDDVPNEGKLINSVFVMRTPALGSVGTILSTPAKSFSGHVYTKIEVDKKED